MLILKIFTQNVYLLELDFLRQKESKIAILDVNAYKECSYQPTINNSEIESRVYDTNRYAREKESRSQLNKSEKGQSISPEAKRKKINEFLDRMKGQMNKSNRLREEQLKQKKEAEESLIEQLRQSRIKKSNLERGQSPINLNIKTNKLRKSPNASPDIVRLSRVSAEINCTRSNVIRSDIQVSELDFSLNLHDPSITDINENRLPIDFYKNSTDLSKVASDKHNKLRESLTVDLDEHVSLNFLLK
jgi:hypothetical protein